MNTSKLAAGDSQPGRRRRIHSAEFKAQAVAACLQPGMSTAAVALGCGVNANLLHRWIREAEQRVAVNDSPGVDAAPAAARALTSLSWPAASPAQPPPSPPPLPSPSTTPRFIALAPPAVAEPPPAPASPPPLIAVELHRADTSIYVTWPASAAAQASAWLRDLPALLK